MPGQEEKERRAYQIASDQTVRRATCVEGEEMARLIGGMITTCKEAGIPDREIATPEEKRLLKERYGVDV